MAYKLLGMAVWKGAKLFLRRRYGTAMVPKPALAGGVIAIALGVLLLARRGSAHSG
jgi:hypothetical protein